MLNVVMIKGPAVSHAITDSDSTPESEKLTARVPQASEHMPFTFRFTFTAMSSKTTLAFHR